MGNCSTNSLTVFHQPAAQLLNKFTRKEMKRKRRRQKNLQILKLGTNNSNNKYSFAINQSINQSITNLLLKTQPPRQRAKTVFPSQIKPAEW
jgi:hypothetical protein